MFLNSPPFVEAMTGKSIADDLKAPKSSNVFIKSPWGKSGQLFLTGLGKRSELQTFRWSIPEISGATSHGKYLKYKCIRCIHMDYLYLLMSTTNSQRKCIYGPMSMVIQNEPEHSNNLALPTFLSVSPFAGTAF